MAVEARARLSLPPAQAIAGFRKAGEAAGIPVTEEAAGLSLQFQRGGVRVFGDGERADLLVFAPDPAALQFTVDMIAGRMADMGHTLEWEARPKADRPANLSLAAVAEAKRLTPSYMRLQIEGPDLARFADDALHFRLLFGPDGADWPTVDDGGVTIWPGGVTAWHRPVYTTRRLVRTGDAGAARIAFDVFLHEGGHTTEWARQARPGEEIAITGPGSGRRPATTGWMGLVGDETAVPAIARILADLPEATEGEATLFVPDEGDIQDLAHPPRMRLRWVLRGGEETPLDALQRLAVPTRDRSVFFAAERSEALAARSQLVASGLAKGEFQAVSYWNAG